MSLYRMLGACAGLLSALAATTTPDRIIHGVNNPVMAKSSSIQVHSQFDCGTCHKGDPADASSGTAKAELNGDVNQLCRSRGCHPDREAWPAGHPAEIRDRSHSSPDLPLDPQGKIGCYTCHDVHPTARGKYFLRKADKVSDLCRKCHWDIGEATESRGFRRDPGTP